MPRLNFLSMRPWRQTTSASSSTNKPLSKKILAYPSRCLYCPKIVLSEASRSKHIAKTASCKAAEKQAEEKIRQARNRDRERGDPLDLSAAARACAETVPARPDAARKRRRVDRPTSPSAEPTLPSSSCVLARPIDEPAPAPLPTPSVAPISPTNPAPMPTSASTTSRLRWPTEARQGWVDPKTGWFIEPSPDPLAGAPVSDEVLPPIDLEGYMRSSGEMGLPYHFEMAELLLTTGLTDAAKNRHLKSVLYRGSTVPWNNTRELYADVDRLPHGPIWHLYELNIKDQTAQTEPRIQYLLTRNVIDVIRDIMGNPAFRDLLVYAPERHWTSGDKIERVYDNMWSAEWWWEMQLRMRSKGGAVTLAPLIIATDQTRLASICGGQKAYPVYLTLGNLGKEARRQPTKRAMVLLGYLPVDAFEDVTNDDERRRMKADLVHRAMETMLAPLKEASLNGVEMWCADGRLRNVFPMVAAYIADWPEQNLHSCTSEGSCPVCKTKRKGRGDLPDEPAQPRDRDETLMAIRAYFDQRTRRPIDDHGLKPVWPWWASLEHVNLATCLTPDLLHQLYQGVFKTHLMRWLQYLVGIKTLDARFASTTPTAGMRHFGKGVSHVQQWTGSESKEMLKQTLPLVAGSLGPELSKLVWSAIEFIYRAHSSSMTDTDIRELDATLATFHQLKELMVAEGFYGSRDRFDKIPKLHMLSHYSFSIRQLGTPDGYNSEAPEHLHIEYAKKPWRASNKVRPMQQMIKYIQRLEAIRIHRTYMDEYLLAKTGKVPVRRHRLDEDNEDEDDEDDEDEDEETAEVAPFKVMGEEVYDGVFVQPLAGMAGGEDKSTSESEDIPGAGEGGTDWLPPDTTYYPNPHHHVAKAPTKPNLRLKDVVKDYGALDLKSATTEFLTKRLKIPQYNTLVSDDHRINIWHRLYLHHDRLPFAPLDPPRRDIVRASPTTLDAAGRMHKAGVWDTVLLSERPNLRRHTAARSQEPEKHGIYRYRAARVRAFFSLPMHIRQHHPGQLAYVELFSPFAPGVSPFNELYSTRPDRDSLGRRRTLVIPVTDIVLACHLSPKFHMLDKELTLSARIDLFAISQHFWFNQYYTHYMYLLIRHWRRQPAPSRLLQRLVRYRSSLLVNTQPLDQNTGLASQPIAARQT